MTERLPTAGQMVHYVLDTGPNRGTARPALVVTVGHQGALGLQVFTCCGHPGGDKLAQLLWRDASHDEGASPGTWHWPVQPAPQAHDKRDSSPDTYTSSRRSPR